MSQDSAPMVPEHSQTHSSHYVVHYPAHVPRESDPHYVDFHHVRNEWKKDPDKWQCYIGKERGDFSECTLDKPLELHHAHVEDALINSVSLEALESQYEGISDPTQVGAWAQSAVNMMVLCQFHHRGHGGAHVASASDWETQKLVKGFIS